MTRINAGIPPSRLHDKHLLAEFRELTRIPNAVRTRKADLTHPIPDVFTLGKGPVRFFYDKLGYLKTRYTSLCQECVHRGFKVTPHPEAWEGIPKTYMNTWKPQKQDIALIEARIQERLLTMK